MSQPQSYVVHARTLLALGLPLIGSHLAQMALHVTDTVLLGWYGVNELAAVVLGTSFFFVLFILGSGFGIAVMGMVASALGRGDETQVRRETRMGLWLSILYSLLTLPAFLWSGQILSAVGQRPEVAALAQDFLAIAGFGMAPALLVMVLKSYLAALEKTQVVLWVTLAAVGVNLAIAWLFIFGHGGMPELGVRGAALASLATQIMTFVLLALYAAMADGSRRFRLFQRFWRPDWSIFVRVLKLGLPVGLTGLAESGLFVAASVMMGWIGTIELAAHGIAMEIAALAFMVHLGLSNAATVRVGRAEGEGDLRTMREAALTATVLSFGFGCLMIALFLSFPKALISPFLDLAKPEAAAILSFGVALLAMAALFQLFDAMQVIALGLLRGVQDTRAPMWLAALSYWVIGVPVSYLLAFRLGFGGPGLWLGLAIGLACAAGLLMARFWRGPWWRAGRQTA
ncbi:MAG TPA: MATE family efflux transporter [Paracoccaceae bacterium]|nr:MATE family efflux transporter [Paracoccaceae bacterium]